MHTAEHTISREMQQCIDECLACYSVCEQTIEHCLGIGGRHAEADHIRTLRDCGEICRTSADFMIRGSSFHARTCAVCAGICRACENECRQFPDDRMMQQCADVCRRCAESCERMAKAA